MPRASPSTCKKCQVFHTIFHRSESFPVLKRKVFRKTYHSFSQISYLLRCILFFTFFLALFVPTPSYTQITNLLAQTTIFLAAIMALSTTFTFFLTIFVISLAYNTSRFKPHIITSIIKLILRYFMWFEAF